MATIYNSIQSVKIFANTGEILDYITPKYIIHSYIRSANAVSHPEALCAKNRQLPNYTVFHKECVSF